MERADHYKEEARSFGEKAGKKRAFLPFQAGTGPAGAIKLFPGEY